MKLQLTETIAGMENRMCISEVDVFGLNTLSADDT